MGPDLFRSGYVVHSAVGIRSGMRSAARRGLDSTQARIYRHYLGGCHGADGAGHSPQARFRRAGTWPSLRRPQQGHRRHASPWYAICPVARSSDAFYPIRKGDCGTIS
jgi:hypothetical protein